MGPLNGLSVVDVTARIAGSMTTMALADYGAQVIAVEPPSGSPVRRYASFRAWGRGKRSVILDLGSGADRASLQQILDTADVLVEELSPFEADRAGLAPEQVSQRHPQIVHCTISGYGRSDQDRVASDTLVAASLGLNVEQSNSRPRHAGWLSVSLGAVSVSTVGILAALYVREFTGRGQHLDVSMLDGALALGSMGRGLRVGGPASQTAVPQTASAVTAGRRLLISMFQCGDGEYIQMHTGAAGGFWRAMQAFGLDGRISPSRSRQEIGEPLSDAEAKIIATELPILFKAKSRDAWLKVLWDADICAQPVLRPAEAFEDPQVVHNKLIAQVDDENGPIRQVGPPVSFSRTPAAKLQCAPALGAHTGEILDELRSATPDAPAESAPTLTEGRSPSHPLEGVRILDLGMYFAGPFASRMLADLGADVIKLEQPTGDAMRPLMPLFEMAQRGKRGIALNLQSPWGQQIFTRLLSWADIVQHNFRPGVAEKLGADYETVRAINPEIIYCFSPGFGSTGPKAQHQSFQPITGGLSGMYYLAAGEGNPPRQVGIEDYFNAALAAGAMVMALLHRQRTGEGQYIESPQVNSALYCATDVTISTTGELLSAFQSNGDQTGWGPLDRLYPTADGWLAITCEDAAQYGALCETVGHRNLATTAPFAAAIAGPPDSPLSRTLETALSSRSAPEWFSLLNEVGVPCEIVSETSYTADFFDRDDYLQSGQVVEYQHRTLGQMRAIGHLVRLSETPGLIRGPAPQLGQHTREILVELGFSDTQITNFLSEGVVGGPPG
jgi:crotonobetainyl-CoA:carnitine CoA-transferase CaiB-like acyl-CoA transferase